GLLADAERRQQAMEDYPRFFAKCDEALFLLHGLQFTQVNIPANLEAGSAAAEEALRLLGLGEALPATSLSPAFTAEEQQALLEGCCELVLVLAERILRAAPAGDGARADAA